MRTNLKAQEREGRRTHILDAARDLFAERGFPGTTMDLVAKSAGFTKRTVYGYFASKEELWCGAMARALEGLAARFREAAAECASGFEQIASMGLAFERFAQEESANFQMMTEGRTMVGSVASETRGLRELGEAHGGMHAAMAEAIRQGIADGSIRPDLDPEITAVLLAVYSSAVMSAVRQADPGSRACLCPPESFMAQSLDFIGHALRTPHTEEQP